MFVDSHCHINFKDFNDDFDAMLDRAAAAKVSHMLCVCVNMEDYPQVLALANQYEHIFASVGVHPCYEDCHDPDVDELLALAEDENVIALGETGLDYFRVQGDMQWQRDRFVRHIEVAKTVNKPLIIHTRAAASDTMMLLEQHHGEHCGGVMHCFAEDWPTAKRALDLGFYISFSGIVTFKSAQDLREVALKTPLEHILIETDAPYLAPVPNRGKRNEPAFVAHTAEMIAQIKSTTLEHVAQQTTDNFFRLFRHAHKS